MKHQQGGRVIIGLIALAVANLAAPTASLAQKAKPQPPPPITPTADRILYDLQVTVKKVVETDIFRMYSNGTGKTQLTPRNGYHEFCAQWSPDGSRVLFLRTPGAANAETVWTMSPTGSDLICATAQTADYGVPSWSPDGSHIAVADRTVGSQAMVLTKPDGTGMARVLQCGSGVTMGDLATWSPDLDPSVAGYQGLLSFQIYTDHYQVRGLPVDIVGGQVGFPDGATIEDSILVLDRGVIKLVWSPDGSRIAWSANSIRVVDIEYIGCTPVLPIDPDAGWSGYSGAYDVSGWAPDSFSLVGHGALTEVWGVYRFPVPEVLGGQVTPIRLGSDAGRRPSLSPPVFPF